MEKISLQYFSFRMRRPSSLFTRTRLFRILSITALSISDGFVVHGGLRRHVSRQGLLSPIRSDSNIHRTRTLIQMNESETTPPIDGIEKNGNDTIEKENYNWASQNWKLAIPALIGMLADPLLSLMDTAYVGRVGPLELAALGACTSIFHLAFNAFRATVSCS